MSAPDGQKLLASLSMEGKFSRDGLQALDEDVDTLTAMARELVTENGVGDSPSAAWRRIHTETGNVIIPATTTPDPARAVENAPLAASLVTPALTAAATVKALKFGSRPPSTRQPIRRRDAPPIDVQFPLF